MLWKQSRLLQEVLLPHSMLSRVNRQVAFCRGIVSLPICSGIAERVYRVQLNLFVCCPYGEYELDLVVESFSGGTIRQQRTSWEIENGPDEVCLTPTATQWNQPPVLILSRSSEYFPKPSWDFRSTQNGQDGLRNVEG